MDQQATGKPKKYLKKAYLFYIPVFVLYGIVSLAFLLKGRESSFFTVALLCVVFYPNVVGVCASFNLAFALSAIRNRENRFLSILALTVDGLLFSTIIAWIIACIYLFYIS